MKSYWHIEGHHNQRQEICLCEKMAIHDVSNLWDVKEMTDGDLDIAYN